MPNDHPMPDDHPMHANYPMEGLKNGRLPGAQQTAVSPLLMVGETAVCQVRNG